MIWACFAHPHCRASGQLREPCLPSAGLSSSGSLVVPMVSTLLEALGGGMHRLMRTAGEVEESPLSEDDQGQGKEGRQENRDWPGHRGRWAITPRLLGSQEDSQHLCCFTNITGTRLILRPSCTSARNVCAFPLNSA